MIFQQTPNNYPIYSDPSSNFTRMTLLVVNEYTDKARLHSISPSKQKLKLFRSFQLIELICFRMFIQSQKLIALNLRQFMAARNKITHYGVYAIKL